MTQSSPLTPSATTFGPIDGPVRVRSRDSVPLIYAGWVPLTPLNAVLRRRSVQLGASASSLASYAHAARLFAQFCAHRGLTLDTVSDADFRLFVEALSGRSFFDRAGAETRLPGERSARTVDHLISLIYSIGSDLEELYRLYLPWRRYRGQHTGPGRTTLARVHRLRWMPPKVRGLPDAQFTQLLAAARDRWGDATAPGDQHFGRGEDLRGALMWRNVALLLLLRYTGARRSEAPALDIADLDLDADLVSLVTKGRRGGAREPVVLLPPVRQAIWMYLTRYRPLVSPTPTDRHAVFVSHATHTYGQRISAQSVRKVLDALRPAVDEPWRRRLRPHLLRHAWAYDLQCAAGPMALTANMRHRSVRSSDPYRAGAELFAEELVAVGNAVTAQLTAAGLETGV